MNQFITQLKNRDLENKRVTAAVFGFYIGFLIPILIILEILIYLVFPGSKTTLNQIGGVCMIVAFTGLALFFKNQLADIVKVKYDTPTLEFLEQVEKRYRLPGLKKAAYMAICLLLIGTGIVLSIYSGPLELWKIVLPAVIYTGCIAIGLAVGLAVHKKKNVPILEQAKKLKENFLAGNGTHLEA